MTIQGPRARSAARGAPKELVNILATALAIFVVVAAGHLIASAVPEEMASSWLTAGAYAAPAALVFAVYWYVAQRL